MRAGYLQFAPVLGHPAANLTTIERLLPAAGGADLLVLPELSNSGYRFENRQQALSLAESIDNSRFLDRIMALCVSRQLHMVVGFNELDGDRLFNTAVMVGPDGVVGKYRKLHLFWDEKEIFEPGNLGLPVFEIAGAKIGLLICFDWVFPEVWRSLALDGAELICHPSNLVLPGLCQRSIPTHAVCNRLFILTANRYGTERDLTFTGRSIVVDPKGNVLHEAPPDQDHCFVANFDPALARDKWITPRNHALDDRRPEHYRRLVE